MGLLIFTFVCLACFVGIWLFAEVRPTRPLLRILAGAMALIGIAAFMRSVGELERRAEKSIHSYALGSALDSLAWRLEQTNGTLEVVKLIRTTLEVDTRVTFQRLNDMERALTTKSLPLADMPTNEPDALSSEAILPTLAATNHVTTQAEAISIAVEEAKRRWRRDVEVSSAEQFWDVTVWHKPIKYGGFATFRVAEGKVVSVRPGL